MLHDNAVVSKLLSDNEDRIRQIAVIPKEKLQILTQAMASFTDGRVGGTCRKRANSRIIGVVGKFECSINKQPKRQV